MTTTSPIARDYELEARLLVRWLGWRWVRFSAGGNALCALWPPKPSEWGNDEWEPSPRFVDEEKRVTQLDVVPPPDERFHDWTTACTRNLPNGRCEYGMPALSTSLDACAMLKAAVMKDGNTIETNCADLSVAGSSHAGVSIHVEISPLVDFQFPTYERNESFPAYSSAAEAMAICRAIDEVKP